MFLRHLVPAVILVFTGCAASTEAAPESGQEAIIQGAEAAPRAWPSMVALMSGSTAVCGGTLIADDWVLTAAHCPKPYLSDWGISAVVIGRHKLSTEEGQRIGVKKVIRHAGFNYFTTANDIALIQLSTKVSAPHVRLARAVDVASIVADAPATVVGWGRQAESPGTSSDVLRQVTLPIVANDACRAYPRYDGVTEDQVCALAAGRGSCDGDSGGPLFLTIDGAPTQIGIVSWSVGCAHADAPSVYTNVARYRAWIAESSEGAVPAE